jgi:hypothetical protein
MMLIEKRNKPCVPSLYWMLKVFMSSSRTVDEMRERLKRVEKQGRTVLTTKAGSYIDVGNERASSGA